VAVTEAHVDANREDQLRWLLEIWDAARQARDRGADIRAVTVWALLGSYDWNCLVTECRGYYEPGPFDVRGAKPRATALADLMRRLASGRPVVHPVLQGPGWWRRPGRILGKPVAHPLAPSGYGPRQAGARAQPILIAGAAGTLGQAFARLCLQRSLACRVVSRDAMDIADPASVDAAIRLYKPWAIVNAGGYVSIDGAERDAAACFRTNTDGPTVLALACERYQLRMLTFSSDQVFDGASSTPYVESSPVAPLNVYGRSKARAEQRILGVAPKTLVVRTSAFFSPWDEYNFVAQALSTLGEGGHFMADADTMVSPTYVPDLVDACLDLLVDGEGGIWHLTNGEALSWAELAARACTTAGIDTRGLRRAACAELGQAAPRPAFSAMHSERQILLPALDDALGRYGRLMA